MEQIKEIRCMILASTQEAAEKFGKDLFGSDIKDGFFEKEYQNHDIKSFCRWPNSPKGLPEFPTVDVIFIRVHDETDWINIVEYVNERALVNFKIVVWDKEIPTLEGECKVKPNICCKSTDKTGDQFFDEIIKSEAEIESLLMKVFKNFDKGGDGFIDVSEIEIICKELGVDTTKADFQETLSSLDVNNDKKISFEEFCDWWKQGRQNSKLMETLISLRLATSNFLNNLNDSVYLNTIKEKVELTQLEKKELVNSYVSINIEKVTMHPEATISLDGYFGGEKKETLSKSYCQFFEEGLKSNHYFLIVEFELKDPSKIDTMIKKLTVMINNFRNQIKYISKRTAEFLNNQVSIMAIKKDEKTICLSVKLRRRIKEQLLNFENTVKSFLDEIITQNLSMSFTLSGEIEKVKENPNSIFIDTFNPAASLELKSEFLKKNMKAIMKLLSEIPRPLKMWLNSFAGGRVELNFNLDYIKSFKNSFVNFPCVEIVQFLKVTLINLLKENLASFGGFEQFKVFYEAIKENVSFVFNTPQMYIVLKAVFNDIARLFA